MPFPVFLVNWDDVDPGDELQDEDEEDDDNIVKA